VSREKREGLRNEMIYKFIKGKGKGQPVIRQAGVVGSRIVVLLVLKLFDNWRWVAHATPRPPHPRKSNWYALLRSLRGPCNGLDEYQKEKNLLPPPGFEPLTSQPVADRSAEYTIPAPLAIQHFYCYNVNMRCTTKLRLALISVEKAVGTNLMIPES
jgi:hypothetical protein